MKVSGWQQEDKIGFILVPYYQRRHQQQLKLFLQLYWRDHQYVSSLMGWWLSDSQLYQGLGIMKNNLKRLLRLLWLMGLGCLDLWGLIRSWQDFVSFFLIFLNILQPYFLIRESLCCFYECLENLWVR